MSETARLEPPAVPFEVRPEIQPRYFIVSNGDAREITEEEVRRRRALRYPWSSKR